MREIRTLLIVLCIGLSLQAVARKTYTQKLQQSGVVKLNQDKTIDLLLNGREADPEPVTPAAPAAKPSVPAKSNAGKTTAPKTPAEPAATPNTPKTTHSASSYTMAAGFRVKFFMGGSSREDKEKAQAVGKEFKNQFPDVPVYMNFNSPHWICVAGDFPTQAEANAFIRNVRNSGYDTSNMSVVKTKIRVPVN